MLPDIEYKRENAPPGDLITNRWTSGDAILQSIGQGDLEVTPLQVATLYATLANGGTLVKPHLAERIERPDGTKLADVPAPARRKVGIDPFVLSSIRAGLLGATHDESGTADSTYAGFEPAVAGKTGTAEKAGKRDYAWFAGYAPADAPEIVVVAIVEQGGFGGDIAAPAAARVFAKYFDVEPPEWPPPSGQDEREPPAADAPTWVLGPDGQLVLHGRPRQRAAAGRGGDAMTLGLVLRRLDYSLLLAVFGVIAVGFATIESATRADIQGDPDYYTTRHLVYLLAGALLGLVAALVDPKVYRRLIWPIYGVTLVGMIVVLGFSAARGSTRWIQLGEFNLQPSEIGKIALIVVLAAIVGRRSRERPGAWSTIFIAALVTAPLFALVFVQPDLGTSTVYVAIALTILFVGGMRLTQFVTLAIIAVGVGFLVLSVLPAAGVEVLRDYQVARVTGFLDSDSEAAYQTTQSKIAIGSGGLLGKGADGATQTSGDFLPEHHTDFVFAVVGEQRGFVGAALVLALYIVIIWRADPHHHARGDGVREPARGRPGGDAADAGLRQRRDGHRPRADDGHPAAVHDVRRLEHVDQPDRGRLALRGADTRRRAGAASDRADPRGRGQHAAGPARAGPGRPALTTPSDADEGLARAGQRSMPSPTR